MSPEKQSKLFGIFFAVLLLLSMFSILKMFYNEGVRAAEAIDYAPQIATEYNISEELAGSILSAATEATSTINIPDFVTINGTNIHWKTGNVVVVTELPIGRTVTDTGVPYEYAHIYRDVVQMLRDAK